MIRGVRGAITVKENTEAEMTSATERLINEVIVKNGIEADQVASVFISVTDDLNAAFPAKVLRSMEGWTFVPVMCMKEISVPSALQKCIRVMFHINTDMSPMDIEHIYLEGAAVLRPDLITE
ncbi:chorismate mutase [Bacillus sp. 03113]|uniref:chorismate mutase n=1 Tax=Bacillus sp. 03113 TaxID=2578211 RepID=UPI001145087F|nr:chorismate mutase [Bacillus sp. 03113]